MLKFITNLCLKIGVYHSISTRLTREFVESLPTSSFPSPVQIPTLGSRRVMGSRSRDSRSRLIHLSHVHSKIWLDSQNVVVFGVNIYVFTCSRVSAFFTIGRSRLHCMKIWDEEVIALHTCVWRRPPAGVN